jgi:26S proteasome regulatory subunit N8
LPTDAYVAIEEIHDDGTPTSKTFEHVTSEIGAEEAEEVGVEHLLRYNGANVQVKPLITV